MGKRKLVENGEASRGENVQAIKNQVGKENELTEKGERNEKKGP